MVTLKADNRRRVQLPKAKPGQVFIYEDIGDGSVKLTLVKAEAKEPFPEGSLAKYWTKEYNAQMSEIAKATIIGVPKEWAEEREK